MKLFYPLNLNSASKLMKFGLIILFSFTATFSLVAQNATNGGQISDDQTVCAGETPAVLTNDVDASGGDANLAIEYLWMTTDAYSSNIASWDIAPGDNNNPYYQPPATGSTTYYIRCARRAGFGAYLAESNPVTITVISLPSAPINGNPGTASIGAKQVFSTNFTPGATYAWDFNGDGFTDCTTQTCSYTYNSAGSYNVSLTVTNAQGCSLTTTQTINVLNPLVSTLLDPCSCTDPANYFIIADYYAHDFILINSAPGQNWTISGYPGNTVYDNNGNALPVGTVIPETSPGVYFLNVWFLSGTGYNLNVSSLVGSSNIVLNAGTTDPCSCISPLPVEFAGFEAKIDGEVVALSWNTSSEINNRLFEVERSTDGINFENIGQVQGAGNSNDFLTYEFIDESPVYGLLYYRIKQIDFDDTFTYSIIKSVDVNFGKIELMVSPNPANDETKIDIDNLPPNASLVLFTSTGKMVKEIDLSGDSETISLKDLPKGIYFLKLKTNKTWVQSVYQKIIKL